MSDLVKRLRAVSDYGGTHLDGLWTEAADRIEALEAFCERAVNAYPDLRDEYEALQEQEDEQTGK